MPGIAGPSGLLWHPADETACVLVLQDEQAHPDVFASRSRAGEVIRDFIEPHVAVIDAQQQLHRA